MTWALCLTCGNTKFGAICPCPECGVNSTGDTNLDILFSDHNIAHKSLEDLGKVIKAISSVTDNPQLRFDTFVFYISENHSELLRYELAPNYITVIRDVLTKAQVVPFELQRGGHGPPKKEGTADGVSVPKRPWWKFWERDP